MNVVSEAYVLGVSTRKVEDLVEAMGARGMSKSTVSRMSEDLDAQVREFRERRLEKSYPYVWLDALYVKVREGSRVVSHAVLIAYAVSEDGEREIIGVDVAAGEMESCWRTFPAGLVGRGLRGVRLVISDAHTGLKPAIRAVLNGTTWQRCTVHFARNVASHAAKLTSLGNIAPSGLRIWTHSAQVSMRRGRLPVVAEGLPRDVGQCPRPAGPGSTTRGARSEPPGRPPRLARTLLG